MAVPRQLVADFALKNPYYAGATVSIHQVDVALEAEATLAPLYAAPTGSTALINPQTLDSQGRFPVPVYVDRPVICTVQTPGTAPETTELGVMGLGNRWRGVWATATLYYTGERVRDPVGPATYVVAATHISGVFATDLANGSLEEEIDTDAIIAATLGFPTGVVNVRAAPFNAAGDGVTDDTAAIQAAIDSLSLTGGVVFFPPGTYLHTGISLTSLRGITLQGSGRDTFSTVYFGTTLKWIGDATSNWINLNSDACRICDMTLQTDQVQTGGVAIAIERTGIQGTRNSVERVSIISPYNGISFWGFNACIAESVYVSGFRGAYGVRFYGDSTYRTDNLFLTRVVCQPEASNTIGSAGFLYEGLCASVFATDCYFNVSDYGVHIKKNGAGQTPGFSRFTRCPVENCRTYGYYLQAASFCTIENSFVGGCGLSTLGGAGNGIYIGADTTGKITLDNNDVRTCGEHGIFVFPSRARVMILNPTCASNSQNAPDTYSGIFFANACDGFQVIGGYCGGGNFVDPLEVIKQKYGIAVSVGCTDFQIIGVNLEGNLTGALTDNSGVSSGGIITCCIGFSTEGSGTFAGSPDGSGNVLITHGLGSTPDYVNVCLLGDTPTRGVEVQAKNSTTITARIFNQADGADVTSGGPFNIMWHARTQRASR